MDIPTPEQIVDSIDAFLARHGMKPTPFGQAATRNPNIVADLRRGHEPSIAVLRRLKDFMDAKDAKLADGEHAEPDTLAEARHHG